MLKVAFQDQARAPRERRGAQAKVDVERHRLVVVIGARGRRVAILYRRVGDKRPEAGRQGGECRADKHAERGEVVAGKHRGCLPVALCDGCTQGGEGEYLVGDGFDVK